MIQGVDHAQVSIPVGSEGLAREFYCGFLGLKEIEKPDILKNRGGLWLQLENLQVHLGAEEVTDRSKTKSHVAYRVSDVGFWKSKLQFRGFQVLDGTPLPGADRIEFRDPFGNRIELIHWR